MLGDERQLNTALEEIVLLREQLQEREQQLFVAAAAGSHLIDQNIKLKRVSLQSDNYLEQKGNEEDLEYTTILERENERLQKSCDHYLNTLDKLKRNHRSECDGYGSDLKELKQELIICHQTILSLDQEKQEYRKTIKALEQSVNDVRIDDKQLDVLTHQLTALKFQNKQYISQISELQALAIHQQSDITAMKEQLYEFDQLKNVCAIQQNHIEQLENSIEELRIKECQQHDVEIENLCILNFEQQQQIDTLKNEITQLKREYENQLYSSKSRGNNSKANVLQKLKSTVDADHIDNHEAKVLKLQEKLDYIEKLSSGSNRIKLESHSKRLGSINSKLNQLKDCFSFQDRSVVDFKPLIADLLLKEPHRLSSYLHKVFSTPKKESRSIMPKSVKRSSSIAELISSPPFTGSTVVENQSVGEPGTMTIKIICELSGLKQSSTK
ncbi:hypothetical protein BC833DRAFT_571764 [Globomyces pollinis-pini]|nr:hypothetical protein BC833DRAFT_571764 [Globomyces pollinis-pini]